MILWLGDPHIQVSNLEESNRLLGAVFSAAIENKVEKVIITGDLFHNHAVIRVEVMDFWIGWIKRLSDISRVVLIEGNHDMPGNKESEGVLSALAPFKTYSNVTVVSKPLSEGIVGYLPYRADNAQFALEAKALFDLGVRYLYCHQTIDGSTFDNGMYAPNGVVLGELPSFNLIISGHIHAAQRFANVVYPGTARWDSASDANKEKAFWLIDNQYNFTPIKTEQICTPMKKVDIREGQELPVLDGRSIYYIELIGSTAWIIETSKQLKGKCRISSRPTDIKVRAKEAKAVLEIDEYVDNFNVSPGVDRKKLVEYVKNL